MSLEPFAGKLHFSSDGQKTRCGKDAAKVKTLPPRSAHLVTCKACRKSLRAF